MRIGFKFEPDHMGELAGSTEEQRDSMWLCSRGWMTRRSGGKSRAAATTNAMRSAGKRVESEAGA